MKSPGSPWPASTASLLAGSGAIREDGITERPTEDVDLFTTSQDVPAFSAAVDQVADQLRGSGYRVDQTRQASQYPRLHLATGEGLQLDADLGVDWRRDDPVTLDVGPVLSLADAVGSKVGALYGRAEPHDYLDVDAIRASGRLSDEQLLTAAAAERDAGFEVSMFAQQLAGVRGITLPGVRRYGVTAEQLETIKTRCTRWAADLQGQPHQRPVCRGEQRGVARSDRAPPSRLPTPATEATRREPGPQARPAQQHHQDPDRGIEL